MRIFSKSYSNHSISNLAIPIIPRLVPIALGLLLFAESARFAEAASDDAPRSSASVATTGDCANTPKTGETAHAAASEKYQIAAADLYQKVPVLNARIEEFVDVRVAHNAPGKEVRAAMRVMLIDERMSRRTRTLVDDIHGEEFESASEGLLRDAQSAASLIDGLLDGSTDLGLEKLNDDEARAILSEVRKQMAEVKSTAVSLVIGLRANLG